MKVRLLLLATFAIALVGAAVAGGTFLGRSLSASPPSSPRITPHLQPIEGEFPLNFQGILLKEDGEPVANSSHSLTFSIYDDPTERRTLWNETQTVFTLDGLFTAELGVEEEIDPEIFSNNPETWLGVRVGTDPEMTPRIRLAYSPYAMHSLTAGSLITPPPNPRQVALLRWYEANLAETEVFVDDRPSAAAFDGQFIWVATLGDEDEPDDDNAAKIRASDGAKVAEINVGNNPSAVAFDGSRVWVANRDDNSLTRFRPDGSRIRTLPLGADGEFDGDVLNRPVALAFDGINMWVVNEGSNSVTKIRAADRTDEDEILDRIEELQEDLEDDPDNEDIQDEIELLESFIQSAQAEISVSGNPSAIAFDGENIWVTHSGARNVTRIRASDGERIDTLNVGEGQLGIAFDGENMWMVNESDNSVTKVRASDGEELDTFLVGKRPVAVAFDGRSIWVANADSNSVTKLRAFDGETLGTFPVGETPVSLAFDGANMWVVNQDDDSVVMR